MNSELLSYRAALNFNKEVFLLNYGKEFWAFEETDKRLCKIAEVVFTRRDDRKKSHVGLGPLLLIINRQGKNAFECLSRYHAYEAWIVLRPALEATLITGKFLDDPANAELWKNRRQIWENRKKDKENYKRYKREFEGDGLIPKSLPHAQQFRQLLSRINDEFVHMNYEYFKRSHKLKEIDSHNVEVGVPFIDEDFDEHKAHLFSFLHIYGLVVVSLGQALGSKYSREKVLNIGIENLEKIWKPKVEELFKKRPDLKELCQAFGLWEI